MLKHTNKARLGALIVGMAIFSLTQFRIISYPPSNVQTVSVTVALSDDFSLDVRRLLNCTNNTDDCEARLRALLKHHDELSNETRHLHLRAKKLESKSNTSGIELAPPCPVNNETKETMPPETAPPQEEAGTSPPLAPTSAPVPTFDDFYLENTKRLLGCDLRKGADPRVCEMKLVALLHKHHESQNASGSSTIASDYEESLNEPATIQQRNKNMTCAINLYGLPRSFGPLVLPSFKHNVIIPNSQYDCDYYVHYYNVSQEKASYSGAGGTIQASHIFLLKGVVRQVAREQNRTYVPQVLFASDTNESFEQKRRYFFDYFTKSRKYAEEGSRYFMRFGPANIAGNIMKMWHSQTSVWELMQRGQERAFVDPTTQLQQQRHYDRVAIFRSDVIFFTPVDIFKVPDTKPLVCDGKVCMGSKPAPHITDVNNTIGVVPQFASYPVNDRMFFGPYEQAEFWASKRFEIAETHYQEKPEDTLHSESFLGRAVFPVMQEHFAGTDQHIRSDHALCASRARADGTIWIGDCGGKKEDAYVRYDFLVRTLGLNCSAIDFKCGDILHPPGCTLTTCSGKV